MKFSYYFVVTYDSTPFLSLYFHIILDGIAPDELQYSYRFHAIQKEDSKCGMIVHAYKSYS